MTACRVLVALAIAVSATFISPPAANAGGSGDCDQFGVCQVHDRGPSRPPAPPKDREPDVPKVPACSSFRQGVVALLGMTPSDLRAAGVKDDWTRIKCRHAGEVMYVWVEPKGAAEQVARSLLAQMQLEPITMGMTPFGSDPVALVGLPVWMWVEQPTRTTWGPATIRAGGVSLTAKVTSVRWDMGDGTKLDCGLGTRWVYGDGAKSSPDCGHTYVAQGTYTIRATSHWAARWSGYGRTGEIAINLSTSRKLPVGELQVIRIR